MPDTPTPAGAPPAAAPNPPAPKNRNQPTEKPSRLPPLDWAAGHGPVTGALSVTTGAGAVALLGAATGMPHPLPLLVGGVGAAAHGIGWSAHRHLTRPSVLTRAGTWLATGTWASWAMGHPLTWTASASLAALGVGIGVAASHAALHEEAVELEALSAHERERDREANRARVAVAVEWEARIKAVTGIGVHIFAVQQWDNGHGFSLFAELPPNATWDRIQSTARALAAAARLPRGVAIHVQEGDVQGRVILDIPTVDVFSGTHPYPDDFSPLSILTGVPWGLNPLGEPITVFLREAGALILGPPGSGKSTFLDGVLIGFSRCTDELTWVIDFKAGAVGLPWVRPWLEAQGRLAPRPGQEPAPAGTLPGVDWLASTPAEALRMLNAALAIGEARQRAYQGLMVDHDTSLLPISQKIPQIMIVIDEGAELLSAANFQDRTLREVQDKLRKVIRTLRAMGIRVVLTAVDGNVSALGDSSIRKFSPVGVALTSAESSGYNLAKLFPSARVDTAQLTAKGAGVIGAATADGFAPGPFKGWLTTPSTVRRAILATNHLRRSTVLDPPSARAAGEDYAGRWSQARAGWLWASLPGADPAGDDTTGANTPPGPRPAPGRLPSGLNLTYQRNQPTDGDSTAAPGGGGADADALAAELMRDLDEHFGTTDEPRAPLAGLNLSYMRRPQDRPAVPELLTRALAAFDAERDDIHSETLAARLHTTQETLGRLLPMVGVTTHRNSITINGKQARGYKREVFTDAIARLNRGEITAPDEVHTWRPDPPTAP